MSNITTLIQIRNKRALNNYNKGIEATTITVWWKKTTTLNVRTKNMCPLDNKRLIENVIYETTVISKNEEKNTLAQLEDHSELNGIITWVT